jgi:hypothetical protein
MIGNRPFPAITPIRPSAIGMARVIVAESSHRLIELAL